VISQRKDMISQREYTTQTICGRTADCECESCVPDVSKLGIPEEGYDIPEGIHDTNNLRKNS
jgi:hypothetical protein